MEEDFRGYSTDTTSCDPLLSKDMEKVFQLGRIIDKTKAWEVIQLLNTFRGIPTIQAMRILFEHFIWNFNPYAKEQRFIDIVFMPGVKKGGKRNGIDTVKTARTNGTKLWINVSSVMNDRFDKEDTHFGELPRGVSHFAAVILHEMGHIIRERANGTTFQYMVDISPNIRRCLREFQEYISEVYMEMERRRRSRRYKKEYEDRKDELEQWVADMFPKSFIAHALKGRPKRPRRRKALIQSHV